MQKVKIILLLCLTTIGAIINSAYSETKGEKIVSRLYSENAKITDAKYKIALEKDNMQNKWRSVIYKYPNIFSKKLENGRNVQVGSLIYVYAPTHKKLWIGNQATPKFIAVNMGYQLMINSDISPVMDKKKVIGLISHNIKFVKEQKNNESVNYILKLKLKPNNAFFLIYNFREVKVWIDAEKWLVVKAEFKDKKEKVVTYEVKDLILVNDQFYFPTKIEKTSGDEIILYKYKDIKINTGIEEDILETKITKTVDIELPEHLRRSTLPAPPKRRGHK